MVHVHKARVYDNCPFLIEIYARKKFEKAFSRIIRIIIIFGAYRTLFDKLREVE